MSINPKGCWDMWAIDNQSEGGKFKKGDKVKYIGLLEEFRGREYTVTGSNLMEINQYGSQYEYSLDEDFPYLVYERELEGV